MPDTTGYWVDKDVEVPVDSIEYDWDATQGQARPLDPEQAARREMDLVKNPPEELIPVKLWEKRAGV